MSGITANIFAGVNWLGIKIFKNNYQGEKKSGSA